MRILGWAGMLTRANLSGDPLPSVDGTSKHCSRRSGVIRWMLDELVAGLGPEHGAAVVGVPVSTAVHDLTEDSRSVRPGALFVARRGRSTDGRDFIGSALDAGASAVMTDDRDLARQIAHRAPAVVVGDLPSALPHLAERFFGYPGSKLSLIGITGTNGKTTVAHAVRTLLEQAGVRCGLIGTVWVDTGSGTERSSLTTPMAIDLSRALAAMVSTGLKAAALEVSSHALSQGRAAALDLDVGVFTNLTRDHLDEHGTMERYAACKAMLFDSLGAESRAIINADCAWATRMVERCRAKIARCTMSQNRAGCARVRIVGQSVDGSTIRIDGPLPGACARDDRGAIIARTAMLGKHNAMNILQAACAAASLGLEPGAIACAIERIVGVPGRLERVSCAGGSGFGPRVFVDFAHTDDALTHALGAIRSAMGKGRLWCVFGCGGDRDRTKRPAMGRVACTLSDHAVLTSDNPRTEDPERIASDVLDGVSSEQRARLHVELDRARAIARAITLADKQDVVVIAGKGHETEQILPDGRGGVERRYFDDRDHARRALARRMGVRVAGPTSIPAGRP